MKKNYIIPVTESTVVGSYASLCAVSQDEELSIGAGNTTETVF